MRYLFIIGAAMAFALPHAAAAAAATPQSTRPDAASAGWSPYAQLDIWFALDPMPITVIDSDWERDYAPRNGKNVALARNRAAIGATRGPWTLAIEARQQLSLVTNKDTLDYLLLDKQHRDPQSPRTFAALAHYRTWLAKGLRVTRQFDASSLLAGPATVHASLAYYTGPRIRDNRLSGTAQYSGNGQYDFDLAQRDVNSQDTFLFMRRGAQGRGASLSLAAEVSVAPAVTLHGKIDDLWSHMRWSRLPVLEQTLDTNVNRDRNGDVDYQPMLRGANRQVGMSTTIQRYGSFGVTVKPGTWIGSMEVARFAGVTMPSIAAGREFGWGKVLAHYETRFRSGGIEFENGVFRLRLQSDAIDPRQIKAGAVQIGYHRKF